MKIVFASTPSQEEAIGELVRHIYCNVFPLYFTDEEISEFEQIKVLHTSGNDQDFSTLKDAFQVMTSMQTIISILDSSVLDEQYSHIFNRNAASLQDFGLFFPFEFDQFVEAKRKKNCFFSVYSKAANELLI